MTTKRKVYAVYYMIVFVIVTVAVILLLVQGGVESQTYAVKVIDRQDRYVTVYVRGCVLNEGYYTFRVGCKYSTIYNQAGLTEFSYVLKDRDEYFDGTSDSITVYYRFDDRVVATANVNASDFAQKAQQLHIGQTAIDLILQYKSTYGSIQDMAQLRTILGELFNDVCYKVHIK